MLPYIFTILYLFIEKDKVMQPAAWSMSVSYSLIGVVILLCCTILVSIKSRYNNI